MSKIRGDLADFPGSVFSGTKINLGIDSGLPPVALGDLFDKVSGVFFADKVNGAAAKAAASHASTAKTGQVLRGFHHDVEFPAANLVKIAQAGVRVAHQFSDASQIPFRESLRCIESSLVLVDDVGTALGDRRGQVTHVPIEQFQ